MLLYIQMVESMDDRLKIEQIYTQYRNVMYAVAYKILQNEQDAEDAVHSAFIRIAENIGKIEEPLCQKTKSFAIIITENRAIDLYRRKKRHPQSIYCDEVVGLTVEYTGAVEVARCIARLPARYREILLLKHRHGYTNREIAAMLGLSLANVNKLEQRAKGKLEEICKEEGVL